MGAGQGFFVFHQLPRSFIGNVSVGDIGQRHDFTHRLAVFAAFIQLGDQFLFGQEGLGQAVVFYFSQFGVKTLDDKAGGAARQVNQLTDQI